MEIIINIRKRKGPLKFDMKKLAMGMPYPYKYAPLYKVEVKKQKIFIREFNNYGCMINFVNMQKRMEERKGNKVSINKL